MVRTKSLGHYLRKQGIGDDVANSVQQLLEEWRKRKMPIWELANKKEEQRAAVLFGRALSQGTPVHFFAPVCPDYPSDSRGTQKLGVGLGETILLVLSLMKSITALLEEYTVPFTFTGLLADTETDLPEIVASLAGSVDEFLERCRGTVATAKEFAPDLFLRPLTRIVPFSEYFGGQWHVMQYFWEGNVRKKMSEDSTFNFFLNQLAFRRREKYEQQLGRGCTVADCLKMAIRHYAQYHALGYWMRQYEGAIMINTDSPNLRAIRRPFIEDYFYSHR